MPTDEPTTEQPGEQQPGATPRDVADADARNNAPPWGDDFDPARAWRLVQRLRADVDDARAERDAAREETERVRAHAASAEDRATAAERAAVLASLSHNLPDGAEEFLTAKDPDELRQQAERLAASVRPREPEPDHLGGRPRPALRPVGSQPEPLDPHAIAREISAQRWQATSDPAAN